MPYGAVLGIWKKLPVNGVVPGISSTSLAKTKMADQFTLDRAIGEVNGTAAEPGPGTRVIADSGGQLSISSGRLTTTGGTSDFYLNPRITYTGISLARATGLALFVKGNLTNSTFGGFGFRKGTDSEYEGFKCGGGTNQLATFIAESISGTGCIVDSATAWANDSIYAVVLQSTGSAFLDYRGSAWRLLWYNTGSTYTPMSPMIASHNWAMSMDYVRVVQLGSPWTTDSAFLTSSSTDILTEGQEFTHSANFIFRTTVTTLANGMQIKFRAQDASNYWRLDLAADGSMVVNEVVADTPTARNTAAAGSIANGNKLTIIADGNAIATYANNVRKNTYSSATYNTRTSGSILALGGTGVLTGMQLAPRQLSDTSLLLPLTMATA